MKKLSLFLFFVIFALPGIARAQSLDCGADYYTEVEPYFGMESCSFSGINPTFTDLQVEWACIQRNIPRLDEIVAWRASCQPGVCPSGIPGNCNGLGTVGGGGTGTGGTGTPNPTSSLDAVRQFINTAKIWGSVQSILNDAGYGTGTGFSSSLQDASTIIPTSGQMRVNIIELNVRVAPNTGATITSSVHKGDLVNVIEIVTGENVNGESRWYKTNNNYYIWAGGVDR